MLQKYTLIKPILETSSKNGTNLKHQGQKKKRGILAKYFSLNFKLSA